MKSLLTFMLLTFTTLASAYTFLNPVRVQNLKINQSEADFGVSYSGPQLSGICGVEIRTNTDIKEVAKLITIGPELGIDP